MISVIIPTHNTKYLDETIYSVLGQTYQDFEIILVPNNGAKLPLYTDQRIKIVEYVGPPLVGAVKYFGFNAASGEYLVELDHDDLLTPTALEDVVNKFKETKADFVYSNFAEFIDGTGETFVYNKYYGWKHRDIEIMGRKLKEMIAFDPTPASIGHIWYAPNHVRAWSREFYSKIGGHDQSMSICDDHELMVRTYLSGKMVRIDKCLYLYRRHTDNTFVARNAEIQILTHKIYNMSIEGLVLRWSKLNNLPCYDLGGAFNCPKGWTSVDLHDANVIADLTKKWPWADSSVGAFRAYDLLEHLPKLHVIKEMYRCLAPGGWVLSFTPSANGNGYPMDPTHISPYVKQSFWYYTKSQFAKFINAPVKFQEQRLVEEFPGDWYKENNIPYVTWDAVCLKDSHDEAGPHDWD